MPVWLIPFLNVVGTILYYLSAFCVALIVLLIVAFVLLVVFGYFKVIIVNIVDLRYSPSVRAARRIKREEYRKEALVLRGMLGG